LNVYWCLILKKNNNYFLYYIILQKQFDVDDSSILIFISISLGNTAFSNPSGNIIADKAIICALVSLISFSFLKW